MSTKRTILAALVVAAMLVALPSLSFAQGVWLSNDTGTPQSYFGGITNGSRWVSTFDPPTTRFVPDSMIIMLYHYPGSPNTCTVRAQLWEDDGSVTSTNCPSGAVTCDGPGTLVWQGDPVILTMASGYDWVGISMSANTDTMQGTFIAGIEYTVIGPSYLADNGGPIPCCERFNYFGGVWSEHWDFWSGPEGVGHLMCRVHGDTTGGQYPPSLRVSKDQIFFGHAMINWVGGPETITHEEVIFTNIGGGVDTVTAITSTNPDFYWTGDALPWYLGGGDQKMIDVSFQTTTEGWRYSDLVITHTGDNAETDLTIPLSGIGWSGHWLENFYNPPDPICGDWWIQRDSTLAEETWAYFSGGYGDQCCAGGHQYSNPDSFVIDWFASSPLVNPDNAGVMVSWMNENRFNSFYYWHAFYWTGPDCTLYHFITEVPPSSESEMVLEGPHYINAPSDSIQIAFLYAGADADCWFIDDIMVDSLEHLPPEIVHEHHSDDGPASFVSPGCTHITAQVLDPNNDPMTVTLHYADLATMTWNTSAMSAVTGCEWMNLWEGTACDLDTCHTYGYYFSADDGDPQTPTTYLPATAPTDYYRMDILDNSQAQIAYDSGTPNYVRYDPTYWEQRFAVRFTPASYPYYLGGAMVMVGASAQSFPDGDHEDIVAEVYDDNGSPPGSPGTLMSQNPPSISTQNGTSWNEGQDACDDTTFTKWVYIKFNPCIEVTSGDFYIAVRNRDGSVGTDKEAFGYDSGPPASPYRTWIFYGDMGQWAPDTLGDPQGHASTNLMVRAIECPCDLVVPTEVSVYKDTGSNDKIVRWTNMGVPYYYVYRSTTSPYSGFTKVATTTDTSYTDTTPDKAFFHVKGSCYETIALPEEPPVVDPSMMTAIGPVRRIPSGLQQTLRVGEEYTIEQQLQAGVWPKTIKKTELERIARHAFSRTPAASSWSTK